MKTLIYTSTKYLVAVAILGILLKYVPQQKLKTSDILIVIAIVFGVQILLDFMCRSKRQKSCSCDQPFTAVSQTITEEDAPFESVQQTVQIVDDDVEDDLDEDDDIDIPNDINIDYGNYDDVSEEETDVIYSELDADQYIKLGDIGARKRYRDP